VPVEYSEFSRWPYKNEADITSKRQTQAAENDVDDQVKTKLLTENAEYSNQQQNTQSISSSSLCLLCLLKDYRTP
jgi:hypothetical protein